MPKSAEGERRRCHIAVWRKQHIEQDQLTAGRNEQGTVLIFSLERPSRGCNRLPGLESNFSFRSIAPRRKPMPFRSEMRSNHIVSFARALGVFGRFESLP